MPFHSFRAHAPGEIRKLCFRISPVVPLCTIITGLLTLAGFAQMSQPPSRQPHSFISSEANRPPDANEQMMLREKNAQRRNFDAANAERLKQLAQATRMLETMAISLKAEVEKSDDLSQNTIHKAETIERLAHIVKDRMRLTVGPN